MQVEVAEWVLRKVNINKGATRRQEKAAHPWCYYLSIVKDSTSQPRYGHTCGEAGDSREIAGRGVSHAILADRTAKNNARGHISTR